MATRANLPLGFAEVALGALLVTAGLTGQTLSEIFAGQAHLGDPNYGQQAASDAADPSAPATTTTAAANPAAAKSARDSTGRVSSSSAGGFVADPGTDFTYGQEQTIRSRLAQLGKNLGVTIHGISGYRTPAHSVAVGGFANDPHTRGIAADIGVDSDLLSSAASITDAQLAAVGLYRPFSAPAEINHVQVLGG